MSLLIVDKAVYLDTLTPIANDEVSVSYEGLDPFVKDADAQFRVGEGKRVSYRTGGDGTFTATVLWPSEMQPNSGLRAIITLPDGVQYAGYVPEGVAGPLTVNGLVTGYAGAPYSWGKVSTTTNPVQVVGASASTPLIGLGSLEVSVSWGGASPQAVTTTFSADGSVVTETYASPAGLVITTTFHADGSITQVYGPPVSKTRTTTFNSDGSISEVLA